MNKTKNQRAALAAKVFSQKLVASAAVVIVPVVMSLSMAHAEGDNAALDSTAKPVDTIKIKMLKPCGTKPNCVSSGDSREAYHVDPFQVKGDGDAAWLKIASILNKREGFEVVESSSVYHRVEFTSQFLKYVDDVEFFLDKEKNIVKIRSQSREGYWDIGANRRRVSQLEEIFRAEQVIE